MLGNMVLPACKFAQMPVVDHLRGLQLISFPMLCSYQGSQSNNVSEIRLTRLRTIPQTYISPPLYSPKIISWAISVGLPTGGFRDFSRSEDPTNGTWLFPRKPSLGRRLMEIWVSMEDRQGSDNEPGDDSICYN